MRVTIGVDEVGFGSIAGPLIVGAVAFHHHIKKPILKRVKRKDLPVRDSKTIPVSLMPLMAEIIKRHCIDHVLIKKANWEIDKYGIYTVLDEAIRSSVTRLLERIAVTDPGIYDKYIVTVDGDLTLGSKDTPCPFKYRSVPKADRDIWQVSAASILAKDEQIRCMQALHERNSKYGWDRNKGYGTAVHLKALAKYGVSQFHRRSYAPVKKTIEERRALRLKPKSEETTPIINEERPLA